MWMVSTSDARFKNFIEHLHLSHRNMKVTVVGQGYVGLTVALGAASAGHHVVGFDIDETLILNLRRADSFVPGVRKKILEKLIKSKRYMPTSNASQIEGSEIVVIAVPTPLTTQRDPDLRFIHSAVETIASNLTSPALIINESTSYPGTLRKVIKPLLDELSSNQFLFAASPERVDPGNSDWVLKNTPRVISGLTDEATVKAINFYASFCDTIVRVSLPEVAEASKVFENTFRQINIALVNEFSEISEKLGFSANEAIRAASTKPFGFMPFYPSIGVGGHCIPIDPTYLRYIADQYGVSANFIELANQTNLSIPKKVAHRIQNSLGRSLQGARVQLAGIAYKPNVEDMRESPSVALMEELESLGAEVFWFDPLVKVYQGKTSTPLDPSVDLGLIITAHDEIDFQIWKKAETRVLDLSANSKNFGWPKFL